MTRSEFLAVTTLGLAARGRCVAQKRSSPLPEDQTPASPQGRRIAEIARSLRIVNDVEYVKRPERVLRLNVYSPTGQSDKPLPAIVVFTHAAWRSENRSFRKDLDQLPLAPTPDLYAPVLAPRGYVVVSADCRLAAEAHFPAQIHDCKCAIRWTRANAARFNIDPDKIGLIGSSASGQLAALAALSGPEHSLDDEKCYPGESSKVQAVYSFAGLFDFEQYEQHPGDGTLRPQIEGYLGGSYAQLRERYRLASPARYVARDNPPFLLMHGTEDRRVPYDQTVRFAEVLKSAGVAVKFVSVRNYAHNPLPGLQPEPSCDALDQEIYAFFEEHLAGRTNRGGGPRQIRRQIRRLEASVNS
jgi:acetyl esterase/lipase